MSCNSLEMQAERLIAIVSANARPGFGGVNFPHPEKHVTLPTMSNSSNGYHPAGTLWARRQKSEGLGDLTPTALRVSPRLLPHKSEQPLDVLTDARLQFYFRQRLHGVRL